MNTTPKVSPASSAKSTGAFFRWDIADEGIAVQLHLNMIELLERDAIRAGDNLAAGVLLGRLYQGRELTLAIEHYQPATPELGALDSPFAYPSLIESMIERWRPGRSRMSVIGFYRTCNGMEPGLNEDDLSAIGATLGNSNPGQKQRLAQASAGEEITALSETKQAPVVARGNLNRSERVFLLIAPHVDGSSQAILYLIRDNVVVCQSAPIAFNRAGLSRIRSTALLAAPAQRMQPDIEEEDDVSAQPEEEPQAAPRKWSSPILTWALLAVALAAIVAIGFFQLRGTSLFSQSADSSAADDAHLGLKLERSGPDWKLSWNQNSPLITKATQGHLYITDGALHKDLALEPSDLVGGNIIYRPLTDNVVLRVEVDNAASQTSSESVRIIGGILPALSATQTDTDLASPDGQTNPALADGANSAGSDPGKPEQQQSAPSPVTPAMVKKAPAAETPAARSTRPTDAAAKSAEELSTILSRLGDGEGGPAKESLSSPSEAEESGTSSGHPLPAISEAARLLSRQDPIYPETARSQGAYGTVEVHFVIDKDGTVRSVSVVKGSPLLSEAAMDAVRKWRYKPAQVNGKPAESDATATFAFQRD